MTKRRIVAVGALAVVVLAISWSAWTWWPPVLRYRIRQIDHRTERVMIEYLDGNRDLASAARTLARLWDTAMCLSLRLPLNGQTARIEDPGPSALDERADGWRVTELVDSAARMTRTGAGFTMYRVEQDSTCSRRLTRA